MATTATKPDHLLIAENPPKDIELEEKEIGFIGPRLPRLMTDEEFKAFSQRLLDTTYD